jgi:hypothetical protein
MPKILTFPIELLTLSVGLEGVREEDLDEPGAQLARSGSDAVACTAISCREDFSGNLTYSQLVGFVLEVKGVLTIKVVTFGPIGRIQGQRLFYKQLVQG